jgi:hypothetical protein
VKKRPHGADPDTRRLCKDYCRVAAAWQKALTVFGVRIRKRPIVDDTGLASHLNDEGCIFGGCGMHSHIRFRRH